VGEADERALLAIAVEAARAGAAELRATFGQHASGVRTKSSPTDLVSDADLAADAAVRAVLAARRPDDSILTEESGASGSRSGAVRWIVDPLDGTVNFLFGIPVFAVSIACADSSGVVAGVVLDPLREECFSAVRSGPAELNGEPIEGSRCDRLDTAMVATGFGYDAAMRARQAAVVARVLPRVRDIRRAGAAAIDLAWAACGRFDAYYERGLKVWDLAAGELIAARAGLSVRELPATGEEPAGLAAAPAGLIEELVELVGG
jgi:myo-inositol-1(or 4)-monophosphatase